MSERFVGVSVVARRMNVCSERVRQWIKAGRIKAIRLDTGHYQIPYAELERLKSQQKAEVYDGDKAVAGIIAG
jgi:excisionase family DNA binding protein